MHSSVPRIAASILTSAAVLTLVLFFDRSLGRLSLGGTLPHHCSRRHRHGSPFVCQIFRTIRRTHPARRAPSQRRPRLRRRPWRLLDILHFLTAADSRPLTAQRVAIGRVHLAPTAQPGYDVCRFSAARGRPAMAGPEISNAVVAIGRLTRVDCLIGFVWLHVAESYAGLTPSAVGQHRVRPPELSAATSCRRFSPTRLCSPVGQRRDISACRESFLIAAGTL